MINREAILCELYVLYRYDVQVKVIELKQRMQIEGSITYKKCILGVLYSSITITESWVTVKRFFS